MRHVKDIEKVRIILPAKPSTPLSKLKVLLWIQPQALFLPIILPQPKNTCDIEVS
jgi:hypothetical protein